jgi:mycofactocin system creatininase family protein
VSTGIALADLSWPEARHAAVAGALLAIPVGATEQHGPHLPLSTDTAIAAKLAELLAQRLEEVVVAPALAYGSSGEHDGFAGTLSIGQQAVELLLLNLVRSASADFRRVLLISAHGGNRDAVARAVERLRVEGRDVRVFFPAWGGDAHAGRAETSLMLAACPSRVRVDRAVAGAEAPLSQLLPALRRDGVLSVSPNGVLGDPAGASAREGRELLDRAVAQMTELIAHWEQRA